MNKIGRRTKQLSGLMVVLTLLAGGLVPPGGAQERSGKESRAKNKDFEVENHIPDPPGRSRLRATGTGTSRST